MGEGMKGWLKKYGLDKILLMVLAGILLLLLALPESKETATEETASQSSLEERVIRILEKRYGEGNIAVMITETEGQSTYFGEETDSTVTGVLVLVRSSNPETAAYDIVSAISALFDVPAHKVIVMEMK
jgi:hypothetical protein